MTKNARKPDADSIEQKQVDADFAFVLSDPRGRRFVWELISSCGVYKAPFSTNFGLMSHAVGRADVGRELLVRLMEGFPNEYLEAQQEHIEREKLKKLRDESRAEDGDD